MTVAFYIALVVAIALAGSFAWLIRKTAEDADEQRRKYNDLHSKYDRATAEIVLSAREHVLRALNTKRGPDSDVHREVAAAFDSLPKGQRTQSAVDAFNERMAITIAAEQVANGNVQRAADEATVVKAENSLLRHLLIKAMEMPSDTPDAKRKVLLERINLNLARPRADTSALADDYFRNYVERHASALGDPTPTVIVGGDA